MTEVLRALIRTLVLFRFCCSLYSFGLGFGFGAFHLLRQGLMVALAGHRLLCSWCLPCFQPPHSIHWDYRPALSDSVNSFFDFCICIYCNCSFVFCICLLRTICCSLPPPQDVAIVAKRVPPFLKGTGGWEGPGRFFYLAGNAGRSCWSFMW